MDRADETHQAIEARLALIDTTKGHSVRYDAEEGSYSVQLHRPDGTHIEIDVAVGVWPDGMDDGTAVMAREIAEWVAYAPGDIAWLLAERVRLIAMLMDAQAAMTPPREVPPIAETPSLPAGRPDA